MKRNYWWKRSYCWRDRQQTSYSGNIVRKIFVKLKHEKTAKRKLCQSQTWNWNYWWIDRQKQSLKIAVAHHDRNNVPTIIFVNVKRNYYQINGEWKYFHENLFVKLKQVTETSDKKEATVKEVVKNHLIIKIFLPKENVKKQLLKISSIII